MDAGMLRRLSEVLVLACLAAVGLSFAWTEDYQLFACVFAAEFAAAWVLLRRI
jgi:hypothetical protein